MNIHSLIAVALISCLGVTVLSAGTDGFNVFTSEGARRLEVQNNPRLLSPTLLTAQSGQIILLGHNQNGNNNHGDKPQWLLVEFIYTRCPDVCYAMGSAFQQIQQKLKEKNLDDKVQLLSISFDPKNDHQALLEAYANRFQAKPQHWNITRPIDEAQLPTLLEQFGIVVIPDKFGGYQHNAAIHLIDDKGRLVDILDYQAPDHVIDELIAQLSPTTI